MENGGLMNALYEFWLVGMMLIFLGIVWWAFKPSNRKKWEERGRIPFKEEES